MKQLSHKGDITLSQTNVPSLFTIFTGDIVAYFMIYVDDILLIGKYPQFFSG